MTRSDNFNGQKILTKGQNGRLSLEAFRKQPQRFRNLGLLELRWYWIAYDTKTLVGANGRSP
ncbi:MAG: hypothetical protein J7641_21495, partial [Cyanobacteria bacterium SID2]|nr:hypothetical protein [Cyanobacteria bacterium SID2]